MRSPGNNEKSVVYVGVGVLATSVQGQESRGWLKGSKALESLNLMAVFRIIAGEPSPNEKWDTIPVHSRKPFATF